jgi:hypothetical protein
LLHHLDEDRHFANGIHSITRKFREVLPVI